MAAMKKKKIVVSRMFVKKTPFLPGSHNTGENGC